MSLKTFFLKRSESNFIVNKIDEVRDSSMSLCNGVFNKRIFSLSNFFASLIILSTFLFTFPHFAFSVDGTLDTSLTSPQQYDYNVGGNSGGRHQVYVSQMFTPTQSGVIPKVEFYMKKVGSPNDAKVYLYSNSNGQPDSNLGLIGSVSASNITTSYSWIEFSGGVSPEITASTVYHLVITTENYDDNDYYEISQIYPTDTAWNSWSESLASWNLYSPNVGLTYKQYYSSASPTPTPTPTPTNTPTPTPTMSYSEPIPTPTPYSSSTGHTDAPYLHEICVKPDSWEYVTETSLPVENPEYAYTDNQTHRSIGAYSTNQNVVYSGWTRVKYNYVNNVPNLPYNSYLRGIYYGFFDKGQGINTSTDYKSGLSFDIINSTDFDSSILYNSLTDGYTNHAVFTEYDDALSNSMVDNINGGEGFSNSILYYLNICTGGVNCPWVRYTDIMTCFYYNDDSAVDAISEIPINPEQVTYISAVNTGVSAKETCVFNENSFLNLPYYFCSIKNWFIDIFVIDEDLLKTSLESSISKTFTQFSVPIDDSLLNIIITPLNTISSLSETSCSDIEIPIPYITGETLTLPCGRALMDENFSEILDIWDIVSFGLLAYWIVVKILSTIKSGFDPDESKLEVTEI